MIGELAIPVVSEHIPGPALLFGLMLFAAIVGGYTAKTLHIPRVVGFLIGGLLLRLALDSMLGAESGNTAEEALAKSAGVLSAVRDLALGLILFSIGHVFERAHLRAVGKRVLKVSLLEAGGTVVGVFLLCGMVALIASTGTATLDILSLALLLALAGIATAPAATLFVLREYDSKGIATDTILTLTGLNNIICIVMFYVTFLALAASGMITTTGGMSPDLLSGLVLTTVGSVVLGLVCGTLISIAHAKLPLAESLLVFFTLFIVLGAGEKWLLTQTGLSFNFLLTSLITGAVFANVAIDAQKLEAALRTLGLPIFAAFFVMAGYDLHLNDLLHIGWLGGAYIVGRLIGKVVGCRLGLKWAGASIPGGGGVGIAMLCQAAVVIGLADFVRRNWDNELATRFSTIILGSVVVFEIVGPMLIKRRVIQAGEVKAVSLLRREGPLGGRASVVHLICASAMRLVGINPRRSKQDPEDMCVRHIMRTNVHFLDAADPLDEVLHFVERSKYHSFPVVNDEGEFVGTIRYQDIREMIYDPALRDLVTAIDLADPDAAFVSPTMPLADLMDVFKKDNLGVLPVVREEGSRQIVGIVEQRDLLATLHRSPQETPMTQA